MKAIFPEDPTALTIMIVTLIVAGALFVLSILLLTMGNATSKNLGGSLLGGAFVTIAVFLLQAMLTANSEHQQRLEQGRRDLENFRLVISVSGSLRGFKPTHPIAGEYLSGKDLTGAYLREQDLKETQFQDAILAQADLIRADARKANFLNADFFKASVDHTDFRSADLRFAKFESASVSVGAKFDGAKVNSETCWPAYFFNHDLGKFNFIADKNLSDPQHPFGHVCAPDEHKKSGPTRY